ncbi:hypothetical protein Turpa_0057 [Turneriella parva DSM 21527]|uniref:Uncharacterized protein n=1 Tax=Turneriella parva (strain ATCC BAA-1111 / DSM 21527 / NCTC 11395 / H) TaxID=869212 RepID=I4B0B3_TURPD|nr:hypothetical protein Turpa_0057 [Turneriella parva DSM 21527]
MIRSPSCHGFKPVATRRATRGQFIFDEPGQNTDIVYSKPAKPLCASASSNLAGLFMS